MHLKKKSFAKMVLLNNAFIMDLNFLNIFYEGIKFFLLIIILMDKRLPFVKLFTVLKWTNSKF